MLFLGSGSQPAAEEEFTMKISTLGLISLPALLAGCAVDAGNDVDTRSQAATEDDPKVIETGGTFSTNDFYGKAGFSNDPASEVGLLLAEHRGTDSCSLYAQSTDGTGLSASANAPSVDGLSCDYQLSTETQTGGVTYRLRSTRTGERTPYVNGQILEPADVSPNGTEVDLQVCAALTEIGFKDCDGNAVPVPENVGVSGTNFEADGKVYAVHQDGESGDLTVTITTGTDIYTDSLTRRIAVPFTAECDVVEKVEFVSVCEPGTGNGTGNDELGALTGPLEVQGETLNTQLDVRVTNGPDGNGRYYLDRDPAFEAPVASPADWWTLPKLPGGDYATLRALGSFGEGYSHTEFQTLGVATSVVAGETSSPVDGTGAHAFVMNPAHVAGELLLRHPLIKKEADLLTFAALKRAADTLDANGLPTSSVNSGSRLTARSASYNGGYGTSYTGFAGDMDVATGILLSGYDQPVLSAFDASTAWNLGLDLSFYRAFDATAPETYRSGSLEVNIDPESVDLAGGDTLARDYNLCFSEIIMRTQLDGGDRMYSPAVSTTGSFAGENGNSEVVMYDASSWFNGFPTSQATAAERAEVHFALPEGTYELTPRASVINEQGAVSSAVFTKTGLEVGCGQRIIIDPSLTVSADVASQCVDGLQTTVDVNIDSKGVEVDRVWYTVNGGEEIDVCAGDCGADTSTSFDVASSLLAGCENDIEVFASSQNAFGNPSSSFTLVNQVPGVACDSTCPVVDPPAAGACLTGTERVDLKDRTVTNASVEAGSFELGADAQVNGDIDVDGAAFVRERGSVEGTMSVEGAYSEQNLVSVETLVENADVTIAALPEITVNAGSGFNEIPNESVVTLAPGAFGDTIIRARSTVTLTAGVYSFASFKVEPDVQLILDSTDGPIEIQSAGDVSFESRIDYQSVGDAGLFVYSGGQSVRLHPQQTFPGSLLAPHALIEIYSHVDVLGCVQGRHVRVEPDSSVTGDGGYLPVDTVVTPECVSDADCGSGESCDAGACQVEQTGQLSGSLSVQSDWETGYCANVTVHNSTADAISTWTAAVDLGGATLQNGWNGSFAESVGTLSVIPESYNQNVAAGQSTSFGFCANKSTPNDAPTLSSVSF